MGEKAKRLDLKNSEEILTIETDSDGIRLEDQSEALKEEGIFGRLEVISEEAVKALKNAEVEIENVVYSGISTIDFPIMDRMGSIKKEVYESTVEMEPGQEEIYADKMREIRELAINDDNEHVFIIIKKNGRYEFSEKTEGDEGSAIIGLFQINEYFRDGAEGIEINHTHPARLAYTQEEIAEIKTGKTKHNPMPPSILDIVSLAKEKDIFQENFSRVSNKVIEPFGIWEYSLDSNGSHFDDIMDEFSSEFDTKEIIRETNLTEEERNFMNIAGEDEFFKALHPSMRLFILINILEKNQHEVIAEKIARTFIEKEAVLKERYPQSYSDFKRIIDDELEVDLESAFRTEKTKKDVKKKMELYKENGVILNYKPF